MDPEESLDPSEAWLMDGDDGGAAAVDESEAWLTGETSTPRIKRAKSVAGLPPSPSDDSLLPDMPSAETMASRVSDTFLHHPVRSVAQMANPVTAAAMLFTADTERPEAPRVGRDRTGEAGLRGLAQGVTMGFGDEIQGGLRSMAGAGDYEQERDAARAANAQAEEQAPGQYLLGELVGSAPMMALPGPQAATAAGRIGQGALTAGGLGLAAGWGQSDAETLPEQAEDAMTTGLTSGALGAAGGAAGEGIQRLAGALARRAPQIAESADRARVLTAMGSTGGSIANPKILREAERVPGGVSEMARVMRETGISRGLLQSTDDLLQRATQVADDSRDAIGRVIQDVSEAGERVDIGKFADELDSVADDLASRPEMDAVAEALRARSQTYRERFPNGATMQQAQAMVRDLGDRVNWTRAATGQMLPNAQMASRDATRAMRSVMDDAVERTGELMARQSVPEDVLANPVYRQILGSGTGAGQDALNAYRGARRSNQVARIVADAAEESIGRSQKNRALGLREIGMAAAAGSMGASPLGAAAAALVPRLTGSGRGAAARATSLEALSRLAQNAPQRLGRYAEMIRSAAQRGPGTLAALHFALSQRDPEYQQLVSELPSGEGMSQ